MGSNRKWGDRKWCDRKWRQSRDRKWRQSRALSGSRFCACATGSWAISALVGPFNRKWQSHVTGRGPVRKWPWPEEGSAHARLFPRAFFLVVVTWLPKVTWSLRGSLWVYATGSCATPVMTEGHVTPLGSILGVFSTTSASYNPRKPRVLYLVTGTSRGYLPLLFSYSVYKGCLRSHCGISKSQMVNLIPTCIVSS
jgi:hypothetical protein